MRFIILMVGLLLLAACLTTPNPATSSTPEQEFLPLVEQPPEIWRPAPGTSWQWQLTDTPVDLSVEAEVYDIDLFDNEAEVVAALHAQGRRAICYINVGAWEEWRPDAAAFPSELLGNEYEGWEGERWLDIRRLDLLAPLMAQRLDQCRDKGFDGVEPDNMDGYLNDTGFPLSYEDQLAYNLWLAEAAHERGLSIGLKNTPGQVQALLPYYDWALTESCFAQGWCEEFQPFIEAGRAVFAAEYSITPAEFCPQAARLRFSAIFKERELGVYREGCPP